MKMLLKVLNVTSQVIVVAAAIGSVVAVMRGAVEGFIDDGVNHSLTRLAETDRITGFARGAVVAFNRADCPRGWTAFVPGAGRFIVGAGRHTINDQWGNEIAELALREQGGERTHVLTEEEMPRHSHLYEFSSGNNSPQYVDHSSNEFGLKDRRERTTQEGRNAPHNNMPPYVALNYCVRN